LSDANTLQVFLVPIAGDRYELYCETPVGEIVLGGRAGERQSGWIRRLLDRFRALLAEADEWQRRRDRGHAEPTRGLWTFVMRKVAEAVAEQRLVWLLRTTDAAELLHADNLDPDRALEIGRRALQRDYEKHRRWMVIDGIAFLAFVPLTVIPGPNVPSIYFSFRALGHFFSLRGASRGLRLVRWTASPSPPLAELTSVMSQDRDARDARDARIREIAHALGLERLPAHLARVRDR
jgi:hypothetical protein